jgi:hypothetical protein
MKIMLLIISLGLYFVTFALPNKYIVVPNRSDSTIAILKSPTAEIIKK